MYFVPIMNLELSIDKNTNTTQLIYVILLIKTSIIHAGGPIL